MLDLLSLPEEILGNIIDQLVEITEPSTRASELRKSRLICRRFACLRSLLNTLFRGINFIACPEYWGLDVLDSILRIAPFVQHVTFVPPLHNVFFDFEDFEEVFKMQASMCFGAYRGQEATKPPRRSARLRGNPTAWDFGREIREPFLHTKRQLRLGFGKYWQKAFQSFELLRSAEFKDVWVKALQQLPRCHSFRLALVDYAEIGIDLQPTMPDCLTYPAQGKHTIRCDIDLAAIGALEFVPVAVGCLAASGAIVHSLDIAHPTTNGLQYSNIREWGQLGCDQLQTLIFQPKLPHYVDDQDIMDLCNNLQADLRQLLSQCSDTLQTLDCHNSDQLVWTGTPIPLPNLRVLKLGICDVSSTCMSEWIASMPKLEKIVFRVSSLVRGELANNWKRIFDAIREHERIKEVELRLWVHESFIDIDTFNKDKPPAKDNTLCFSKYYGPWFGVEKDLPLYICGIIEWGGSLNQVFDAKPADEPADDDEWE